jgi:hypothetical protein
VDASVKAVNDDPRFDSIRVSIQDIDVKITDIDTQLSDNSRMQNELKKETSDKKDEYDTYVKNLSDEFDHYVESKTKFTKTSIDKKNNLVFSYTALLESAKIHRNENDSDSLINLLNATRDAVSSYLESKNYSNKGYDERMNYINHAISSSIDSLKGDEDYEPALLNMWIGSDPANMTHISNVDDLIHYMIGQAEEYSDPSKTRLQENAIPRENPQIKVEFLKGKFTVKMKEEFKKEYGKFPTNKSDLYNFLYNKYPEKIQKKK